MKARKPQELQFERLESCSYLGGNVRTQGKAVANGLRENQSLWDAFVVAARPALGIVYELVEMASCPARQSVFLDVIYVATTEDRLSRLLAVIDTWKPDEVQKWTENLPSELLANSLLSGQVIVRAWWD